MLALRVNTGRFKVPVVAVCRYVEGSLWLIVHQTRATHRLVGSNCLLWMFHCGPWSC